MYPSFWNRPAARRRLFSLVLISLTLLAAHPSGAAAQPVELPPDTSSLAKKPIAEGGGPVGDLLRQWWKEGTAAGNAGDWYDNRDRGHSDMDIKPWPQLQRIVYTKEQMAQRRDWAAQTITRKVVVFGNSSTSAPPLQGGSNIRMYYTQPAGLALLYRHYTHNNLYLYPEHRDHDPGHNGRPDGYGDLYPTNTPYLIASQGSSGSDQPFMRALPYTLAAFRPDVKKKLVETGLLMPTVQMILRSTNKHLKDPSEYLTGKAHPTVFEGSWVDPLKMVKTAHAIEPGNIPPMVQLKVVEEDRPVQGVEFFDAIATERLADTPASISRIVRSRNYLRKIVVSAEDSYDVNKRPLTFRWVVLRGDAERIKVRALNQAGSVAEIVVPYHDRRPVAAGSALESNRVDVGVFVHNGAYHSAPGFVTFFSLDNEARTYDAAGRILEIGYDRGEVVLAIRDWEKLLQTAAGDSPQGRLLQLSEKERNGVAAIRNEYRDLDSTRAWTQQRRQEAGERQNAAAAAWKDADGKRLAVQKEQEAKPSAERKAALGKLTAEVAAALARRIEAEARAQAVAKTAQAAEKALQDFLRQQRPDLGGSLQELFDRRLSALAKSPTFYNDNVDQLRGLLLEADGRTRAAFEAARRRLAGFGLLKEARGDRLTLQPIRPGDGPLAGRLTPYEKLLLERFHTIVLTELLLPGIVGSSYQPNFVDQRLAVPKLWRDVYRHDAKGNVLGWTRYDGDKATAFNAAGMVILEKDDLGRCRKARTVQYAVDPKAKAGYDQRPLRWLPGDEVVTYEFDGPQDTRGRVKSREPVKE